MNSSIPDQLAGKPSRIVTSFSIPLAIFAGCAAPQTAGFSTPEEAVRALTEIDADYAAADELFGPGAADLLFSGDEVADRLEREFAAQLVGERLEFEEVAEGRQVALLGEAGWELPIPLVLEDGRWHFDIETGREEVLNRRVGRNELSTIATLRALAAAQREYFAVGRDDNPPAFAQKLLSSEGLHDGLYWPVAEGEPPSPIGRLLARASDQGYRVGGDEPTPFQGYHFRLLTAQGEHAPGGPRSYIDEAGHMTGGFAVLAWPAIYDNSGVMSFQVGAFGIVYEKDLGDQTAQAAAAIEIHDPDPSWRRTED